MLKEYLRRIEDIQHYCRVATAIAKTIEVQEKVDHLYSRIEDATISFSQ